MAQDGKIANLTCLIFFHKLFLFTLKSVVLIIFYYVNTCNNDADLLQR